jgi:hypothetical protein
VRAMFQMLDIPLEYFFFTTIVTFYGSRAAGVGCSSGVVWAGVWGDYPQRVGDGATSYMQVSRLAITIFNRLENLNIVVGTVKSSLALHCSVSAKDNRSRSLKVYPLLSGLKTLSHACCLRR